MNEQIQKLAEQARKKPYGDSWTYRTYGEFEEKFAELIIRKCLEIMDDEDDYAIERSARMAAHRIKEHFGVKE